jgi:transcriptional regulator with XRE-family HTH domain
MVNNSIVSRIAQKIRATRLEKNLTLQELARRSSVSKGLLSKIENSRTIPSLPVFVSLIQSLDISLKEFFHDMVLTNGKDYLLVKRDQYISVDRETGAGVNYRHILSQNIVHSTMEATILTVEPGAAGNTSSVDGYGFKYVLSGSCEYQINHESIRLEEGDSLYFDASAPHLPVNRSRRRTVLLAIYFLLPQS